MWSHQNFPSDLKHFNPCTIFHCFVLKLFVGCTIISFSQHTSFASYLFILNKWNKVHFIQSTWNFTLLSYIKLLEQVKPYLNPNIKKRADTINLQHLFTNGSGVDWRLRCAVDISSLKLKNQMEDISKTRMFGYFTSNGDKN